MQISHLVPLRLLAWAVAATLSPAACGGGGHQPGHAAVHPLSSPVHADDPIALPFDPRDAEPCLSQARLHMRARAEVLDEMIAALSTPPTTAPACRPMRAEDPFAAFEGWWQGEWAGMPVRHLWRTVEPGVQLVVLSDGGQVQRGINLATADDQICGIVRGEEGQERLHQGRFVPATRARPPVLVWATPTRLYLERVTCSVRGPTYEIFEHRPGPDGWQPSTTARYEAPRSAARP